MATGPLKLVLSLTLLMGMMQVSVSAFDTREKFRPPKMTQSELDRRIQQNPKDALALCDRGDLFLSAAEVELALSDYTRAIEADPKLVKAHLRKSQCFSSLGKPELALKEAEAGLRLNTNFKPELVMQKIDAYQSLKRFDDCLREYTHLVESKDLGVGRQDRCKLWLERAELYMRLGKPKLALADTDRAMPNSISLARIATIRAKAHMALHQPDLAANDYTYAISRSSVNKLDSKSHLAKLLVDRAEVYKQMGKTKEAEADFNASKKLGEDFIHWTPFQTK